MISEETIAEMRRHEEAQREQNRRELMTDIAVSNIKRTFSTDQILVWKQVEMAILAMSLQSEYGISNVDVIREALKNRRW